MTANQIWVDFNEFDPSRRVIPISKRSIDEFERTGQKVREGAVVRVYMEDLDETGERDDLVAEGIARFDSALGRWLAVELGEIHHTSELTAGHRAEELIG
jgi:hypothetical protein